MTQGLDQAAVLERRLDAVVMQKRGGDAYVTDHPQDQLIAQQEAELRLHIGHKRLRGADDQRATIDRKRHNAVLLRELARDQPNRVARDAHHFIARRRKHVVERRLVGRENVLRKRIALKERGAHVAAHHDLMLQGFLDLPYGYRLVPSEERGEGRHAFDSSVCGG